jgi:hypothetical protein
MLNIIEVVKEPGAVGDEWTAMILEDFGTRRGPFAQPRVRSQLMGDLIQVGGWVG